MIVLGKEGRSMLRPYKGYVGIGGYGLGFMIECGGTGEHRGVRGLAGVCEEVGEGRGTEADPRGSGPCAGDCGSGAAGDEEQERRTGRSDCPTREQSGTV